MNQWICAAPRRVYSAFKMTIKIAEAKQITAAFTRETATVLTISIETDVRRVISSKRLKWWMMPSVSRKS